MKPPLLVWAIYLFVAPFYVFKVGLPQPGDVLILILAPVALSGWNGQLPRTSIEALRPLLGFIGWAVLVNVAWAVITGHFGLIEKRAYLLFPIYYVYNGLIFLVTLVLHRRYGDALLRITLYTVLASLGLMVVYSVIYPPTSGRGTLFFSNPNQLGYHALLTACLVPLLHRRLGMRLVPAALAIVACGYLTLLSGSRAAVAGIAILLAILVFASPRAIILASLGGIVLVTLGEPILATIETKDSRALSRRTSTVSFADERGYNRIATHPHYVILGAGEGGLDRFEHPETGKAIEMHSSPGTILFSYGIVGSLLFLAFAWRVVRGAPLRTGLILLAPVAYSVAHQGLRFTMLWVLLAVFVALKSAPPDPAESAYRQRAS